MLVNEQQKNGTLLKGLNLEINMLVYFGAIISFLFIFIVDRHVAVPFIIAEFFAIYQIFKLDSSIITEILPIILIIVGQVIFLKLGLKRVYRINLILFFPLLSL